MFGWFDGEDGCYYQLMSPQPPAGTAYWAGHQPGDGAIYSENCPLIAGSGLPGGAGRWFQNPPPGYGGGVDVQALAQQAVSKMALVGPAVGIAPPPGTKGVVGLPVWLWDNVSPTTWGPNTAAASAGGVTVTATGSATQIVWTMGDGATVTCDNPGVAYQASFGAQVPVCGHIYTATSDKEPGGKYTITATSTWVVDWTATTGQTGQITVTRQSNSAVEIGELRTVNN
ncbi:ATP/GTP-binding protein [Streptacidiphilus rugosus]|uniref:ATP/GTP-binding protein n=1 Tax=Streptacidiphilus rugosus TaxID=405783 RepID=UPI000B253608|nr:ATP/GTP-binding protein [Streptacidiphilus rugosus]